MVMVLSMVIGPYQVQYRYILGNQDKINHLAFEGRFLHEYVLVHLLTGLVLSTYLLGPWILPILRL